MKLAMRKRRLEDNRISTLADAEHHSGPMHKIPEVATSLEPCHRSLYIFFPVLVPCRSGLLLQNERDRHLIF